MNPRRLEKLCHGIVTAFLNTHFPSSQTRTFITVTAIDFSSDGKSAEIALSFLSISTPREEEVDAMHHALLREIRKMTKHLQRFLSKQLGKKVPRLPAYITFKQDRHAHQVSKLYDLLRPPSA